MTIDPQFLGAPPVGLVEKSRRVVEHIVVFLANGYITYQMFEGVSHYSGAIDYERVTLQ
jgi:hypothetical protein